jgi:hypothetical protein
MLLAVDEFQDNLKTGNARQSMQLDEFELIYGDPTINRN